MSEIEGVVRPLIEPMIKGYPASLTTGQQITAATWATMKTAVIEHISTPEQSVFTADDREVNQDPEAASGQRPGAAGRRRVPRLPAPCASGACTNCAVVVTAIYMTLSIGCLVAQVFGGPGAGQHGFQAASRTGADFIAIYPPQARTVQWPPATALDDTALLTFAHPLAALTGP